MKENKKFCKNCRFWFPDTYSYYEFYPADCYYHTTKKTKDNITGIVKEKTTYYDKKLLNKRNNCPHYKERNFFETIYYLFIKIF